jgi:hypothetical protein
MSWVFWLVVGLLAWLAALLVVFALCRAASARDRMEKRWQAESQGSDVRPGSGRPL